ncbi:hypothetical protein B0H14DRAFT_2565074 [Mycena olivaceomarginata]|nr:hypothetical protein B0H14DRAFT_2565074 [Mycena olivaceomarginata]
MPAAAKRLRASGNASGSENGPAPAEMLAQRKSQLQRKSQRQRKGPALAEMLAAAKMPAAARMEGVWGSTAPPRPAQRTTAVPITTAHENGSNTPAAVSEPPRRSPRDHQTAGRGRGRGTSRPSANRTVTNNRTSLNRAAVALDVVKVMYWNIYHGFTLKLTDSEFHDVLSEYDIMFFAETDMLFITPVDKGLRKFWVHVRLMGN